MKAKYNIYKGRPINYKLVRYHFNHDFNEASKNNQSSFKCLLQLTSEYLAFAALSKLIAAVTTYPYQVVRARLQECNSKYSGSVDCVRRTFRYEGISGLYKGLTPYLAHVLPNICIVLIIYETFTNWRLIMLSRCLLLSNFEFIFGQSVVITERKACGISKRMHSDCITFRRRKIY